MLGRERSVTWLPQGKEGRDMVVTRLPLDDREYTERSSKEVWLLEEVSKEELPTATTESPIKAEPPIKADPPGIEPLTDPPATPTLSPARQAVLSRVEAAVKEGELGQSVRGCGRGKESSSGITLISAGIPIKRQGLATGTEPSTPDTETSKLESKVEPPAEANEALDPSTPPVELKSSHLVTDSKDGPKGP